MHALKKIQKLEDDFREKLSTVYDCDPDDLPIDLDTLTLYNLEPSKRRGSLVSIIIIITIYSCAHMLTYICMPFSLSRGQDAILFSNYYIYY